MSASRSSLNSPIPTEIGQIDSVLQRGSEQPRVAGRGHTCWALGERKQENCRPDGDVRRGSRCWNRRHCFYSVLPSIQIIYPEVNSKAGDGSHNTYRLSIYPSPWIYVYKVYTTPYRPVGLVWVLPWWWGGMSARVIISFLLITLVLLFYLLEV